MRRIENEMKYKRQGLGDPKSLYFITDNATKQKGWSLNAVNKGNIQEGIIRTFFVFGENPYKDLSPEKQIEMLVKYGISGNDNMDSGEVEDLMVFIEGYLYGISNKSGKFDLGSIMSSFNYALITQVIDLENIELWRAFLNHPSSFLKIEKLQILLEDTAIKTKKKARKILAGKLGITINPITS